MAITGTDDSRKNMKLVVEELEVNGEPYEPLPATIPATQITVAGFTTAGSTEIAAGTLQEVLEALGDLADPAA